MAEERPLAFAAPPPGGTFYVDYYDHMLDRRGEGVPEWNRNNRDDFPTKRAQLALLETYLGWFPSAGATVPRWGVGPGQSKLGSGLVAGGERVVVYTDETMHQGEGKEIGARSLVGPDQCWAEYVPHPMTGGESVRWLRVGARGLVLRHRSPNDWRSNVGTELAVVEADALPAAVEALCDALQRRLRSPLLAIDLTVSYWGSVYATDLNLAPGLRGADGIQDALPPRAAADEIRRFFHEACRG